MTLERFNAAIDEQLELCRNLLIGKGKEYAPKSDRENQGDRLEHFKKAAALTGGNQKKALLGMFSKHIISICDMCSDSAGYTVDKWNEKITDSINYLLILKAMVTEEADMNGQN